MSDDDIEIIDPSLPQNNDICQLCPANLDGCSTDERQDHYRKHSAGCPIRPLSKRARRRPLLSQRKTSPLKPRKTAKIEATKDVFWYPAQAKAPPENYTPGVLSILKEALKRSHTKGVSQRAVLCYLRTPHIYRESFDSTWGCGYRNFLMACAALMDQQFQTLYFPNLESPLPPGVRNLQHWIEDAWKHGYDDIGATDLDHKLVNTEKKLGTGELYVAFTSRKIPCVLVDFDLRNSHKGFDALTDWVVNYFTEQPKGNINQILRSAAPVVATDKMPVIMQYDGHSTTIVGYKLGKNGKVDLLVFDPSRKVHRDIRQAALNGPTSIDWPSSSSSFSLLEKSKRRGRSMSPAPKKRLRPNQDSDDEVFSVPDSEDEGTNDASNSEVSKAPVSPDTMVKAFMLNSRKLKLRKKEYQLLYFTMGDPLSEQEQGDRKVVSSVIGC